MDGPDYVVPATEGGGFAGLTASATELLNKVNTMPFDQIGKNLDGILKSANDLTQGPQMKKALTELAGMIGVGPEHGAEPQQRPRPGGKAAA